MKYNNDYLKAAVLFKIKKKLSLINLKIPKLQTGQVLVKIYFSGICRSQLMEIEGGRDNKSSLIYIFKNA